MSVAEVDKSGPFSRFDGVERWFAVLEGAGVQLDVGGERHRLTAGDVPFFFDGAAATGCELIDGKTQDFNLMVRKGRAPSRMVRVSESLVDGHYLRRGVSMGIPQIPILLAWAILSIVWYSKGASGSATAHPLWSIHALRSSFPVLQLAVMLPSGFVALGMQRTKSPEILNSSASDALGPHGTGLMKV